MDGNATVRVGVLGYGNVGSALVALVAENGDAIEARTGLRLQVTRVAVKDMSKARAGFDNFTADAMSLVTDPEVDLIVEVIGGLDPARDLVLAALKAGKPVVTGNKELMAASGAELFDAAAKAGVDLLFEAAVAGAIPLMRPLRESLAGDRIQRVLGIVNGTTNFILTRMTESGASFADALAEAQALGYAERDPTADVEGHDAAAKAAIIASLAFGVRVVAGDVYREGISRVTADDIRMAGRLGYVVKLLAVIDAVGGEVAVRVHPAMVPLAHPLAAVRESFNAVFVEGAAAGELMFYGRGAGGRPTASAALGDVIDAAANLRQGTSAGVPGLAVARIRPMDEVHSQYYLSLDVADRPGVLEQVAAAFARHLVSIVQVLQVGMGGEARLVLVTHTALERDMQSTLAELRDLDAVDRVGTLLRVIGAE
ncbi:MAG TPA: homoserine dehydrogenase [Acidimicrobiales bacterium]|jgi:homoserine dehydrogenase|nr:homoserine dehydrogenase [Acidimicrobiales bacterium]